MIRILESVLAIAVACVLCPVAAGAQLPPAPEPEPTRGYVAVRLGAFAPTHKDYDLIGQPDAVVDFELTGGFMVSPTFAIEGAIGRTGTMKSTTYYSDLSEHGEETFELAVTSFTAGVRLLLPAGRVTFHGLAGIGSFQIAWDYTDDWYWGTDYGTETDSGTESGFGFYLGAGLGFPVTPRVDVGVEARYAVIPFELDNEDFNADGARVGAFGTFRF